MPAPNAGPNAVELTVDAAYHLADRLGAGTFPWVLAITAPYRDDAQRRAHDARQSQVLTGLGLLDAERDRVDPAVAEWIRVVCFPDRWLELRFVNGGPAGPELLRGVVARRGDTTVVALRNAQLITLTAMDVDEPHALVPIVTAGLRGAVPARFDGFALPARAGARADERLRAGADLDGVLDYLGVPESARPVVRSVFGGRRSYVEIVAGGRRDGRRHTSEVGVAVVDTDAGRVLVSPSRAFDGQWVSTFEPGTPFAVALALTNLTATLPGGQWFASPARQHI